MEELDLMENTAKEIYQEDDVEVFRMKNKHFQAAKKYLVCLNLSKYSVEKGDEFEITLNKKTHHSIISQIKEFTSEEIIISNYERSLSAMNILSENYLNVHFIISRSTLLLYGLKRDVSLAKLDLLAQLGNPDEINMGTSDCTATHVGGKDTNGQCSQEKDSTIIQTKSSTLKDKLVNCDEGRASTFIESISLESTSVESTSVESTSVESTYVESTSINSTLIRRSEKEMCNSFFQGTAGRYQGTLGSQPQGDMRCFYSIVDVEGNEREGSLVIEYHIPAGIQMEELQHPSPGKPYKSVNRTAYLPATDDGFRALRLLRVAFHRRLIFTIDVSHTTQMEGIVWNIHHKTSRHASTHGYPDRTYLSSLMDELRQYGVTEDSLTEEEKRLVEQLMKRLSRKKD